MPDKQTPVVLTEKAQAMLDQLNKKRRNEALIDDLKKSLNKDAGDASSAIRSWLGDRKS